MIRSRYCLSLNRCTIVHFNNSLIFGSVSAFRHTYDLHSLNKNIYFFYDRLVSDITCLLLEYLHVKIKHVTLTYF